MNISHPVIGVAVMFKGIKCGLAGNPALFHALSFFPKSKFPSAWSQHQDGGSEGDSMAVWPRAGQWDAAISLERLRVWLGGAASWW